MGLRRSRTKPDPDLDPKFEKSGSGSDLREKNESGNESDPEKPASGSFLVFFLSPLSQYN